jgi:hypothetical protein
MSSDTDRAQFIAFIWSEIRRCDKDIFELCPYVVASLDLLYDPHHEFKNYWGFCKDFLECSAKYIKLVHYRYKLLVLVFPWLPTYVPPPPPPMSYGFLPCFERQ